MNARRVIFLCFFVLVISSETIKAQVLNVEKFRMDADTSNVWAGNLTFGFDVTKRSKQTLQLNNQSDLVYLSRNHSFLLINDIRLISVGDNISNEGYTHFRTTFLRKQKFAPELFTQYQYSQDWGLSERILLGGTLRYMIYSSDNFSASVTTGAMYEYERWAPEEAANVTNRIIKSTNSANVRGKITPTVSLLLMAYYQAPFDDFTRPRLTGDINLQFAISRILRFSAGFNVVHDANPVEGVESWTYEFKNRLIISI